MQASLGACRMLKSQIQKNVVSGSSPFSATNAASAAMSASTFCMSAQLTKTVAQPTCGLPVAHRCWQTDDPGGAACARACWLLPPLK